MNEHEAGFLKFVGPRQARRMGSLLEMGKKGRKKFRAILPHNVELRSDASIRISPGQQKSESVYQELVSHGAPKKCWVMSEDPDLDGVELDLKDALDRVVGFGFGTFISCIPGELGYYEFEDMGERYLLRQKPSKI